MYGMIGTGGQHLPSGQLGGVFERNLVLASGESLAVVARGFEAYPFGVRFLLEVRASAEVARRSVIADAAEVFTRSAVARAQLTVGDGDLRVSMNVGKGLSGAALATVGGWAAQPMGRWAPRGTAAYCSPHTQTS